MSKGLFVVEDDEHIRHMLTELLQGEGYRVSAFPNGLEALIDLKRLSDIPSAIVLDLMMPVMNGYQLKDELSGDERLSGIPVLILSADDQATASKLGVDRRLFLRKPIDIQTLLKAVSLAVH